MFINNIKKKTEWECFKCKSKHPNTLRYCPHCNIAKIHSDNLQNKNKNENNRKK